MESSKVFIVISLPITSLNFISQDPFNWDFIHIQQVQEFPLENWYVLSLQRLLLM